MLLSLLLVVEDEFLVAEMLEHGLSEAGFEVLLASDGTKAVSELEDNAERFKVLITDVDLGPGPSGWDVARKARELVHDLPVIYATGGNAHEWSSKGVPKSVLVTKPFVMPQIITAIANLLADLDSHRASN